MLKTEKIGTIEFSGNEIDITDPCYDKDVFCRARRKILPGRYDCYVETGKIDGYRIVCTLTILTKSVDLGDKTLRARKEGYIGVDAGVAGFFENKPDYDDSDWNKICSYIYPKTAASGTAHPDIWLVDESTPLKCRGFFSQSGYGDGMYAFYQLTSGGKFAGYKIKFLGGC